MWSRQLVVNTAIVLSMTLGVAGLTQAQRIPSADADVPRGRKLTSEQVLRWIQVPDGALESPVPRFRELAREVAAGSNDARVLRAYTRLFPRLYPFDFTPRPRLSTRGRYL